VRCAASRGIPLSVDDGDQSAHAPLFRGLLPSAVVLEESAPERFSADLGELTEGEAALMAKAVDKRRREYTAGRVLARRAAEKLGLGPIEVLPRNDRAPGWPEGVVGSITHTRGHVAVALARRETVRGLGLDVEQAEPLKHRLWDMICTDEDRAMLARYPEPERSRLAKIVFSAKEAAYKAQFAITEQFLGFSAMHIDLDVSNDGFVATFRQESGDAFAPGDTLTGKLVRTGRLVATAVVIER
jgi:4'-phosphopantetheinyl transferase EntD